MLSGKCWMEVCIPFCYSQGRGVIMSFQGADGESFRKEVACELELKV